MGRIVAGMLAVVLLAGTTACSGITTSASAQAQPKDATPSPAAQKPGGSGSAAAKVVTVVEAAEAPLKLSFQYTGTLESTSQVSVVPQLSGRLDQLMVDVGSQVKKGDTIAVLQQDTLQLAVQQAQANLASAQAKLATILAGGRPESVASAQAALDSAQTKLNQLKNPSASDTQAARTTLEAAKADLASNLAALDRIKAGPTQDVIAAAQRDVDSYASTLQSAQVSLAQLKNPTPADIASAEAAVDAARQNVTSAEDLWQMVQAGNLAETKLSSGSVAQLGYESAKAAYDAAKLRLSTLQNPTAAAIQSAQTQVDNAQSNYKAAIAKLNTLKSTPTPQDVQQAQAAVDKSRTNVEAAQAKLDQLLNPTDNDIQIAQLAVQQAQQALALQQQPYTAQDLQSARAAVDQTQAAVDSAKVQLSQATLVAPFDGVITQRLVSPGALVSPTTPIATLYGNEMDIPVSFEESNLSLIKQGLTVALAFSAYPGQSFAGKVAGVYPSADPKTHTFVMKVVPDDPEGKLRVGMFAGVSVAADQRD
ncbi:MAG TPA: efflux RND transporter periplasmic adaptor subunit, partial [Chloroflexota bacterium]|nr:efflux RND transporter periplasmic adaptor subunit [Chloroflexota bacterium]